MFRLSNNSSVNQHSSGNSLLCHPADFDSLTPSPTQPIEEFFTEVWLTPTKFRIEAAKLFVSDNRSEWLSKYTDFVNSHMDDIDEELQDLFNELRYDIEAVLHYRYDEAVCDSIDMGTFSKWFPNVAPQVFGWLDCNYDFIYNTHGLQLLRNRYLKLREPIQYYVLRTAILFSKNVDGGINYSQLYRNYKLFATGFLQASSILVDADNADERIIPGEACCLMDCTKEYNREFIKQMDRVCTTASQIGRAHV